MESDSCVMGSMGHVDGMVAAMFDETITERIIQNREQ